MNARSRNAFGVKLVVAGLGCLLAAQPVYAADPKPAPRAAREAIHEDALRKILPLLLATIPSAERDSLGLVTFRATEDENPYQSGIKHRSSRVHEIYLSRGLLSAVARGSEATLISSKTRNFRELIGFSKYYVSILQTRWAHPPAQLQTPDPLTFPQYLSHFKNVDPALLRSTAGDPVQSSLVIQTLAWVIAHHVEHSRWLAQHKLFPGRVTMELERTFDRKASELTHRAGYSPMPVFANALLFSAFEYPRHGGAALCRGIGIVADSVQIADKEHASAAHSRSASVAEDFLLAQRADLDRLRRATGCSLSSVGPSN